VTRAATLVAAAVVLAAGIALAPPAGATTKQFCAAYKPFNLRYAELFEKGVPSTRAVKAADDDLDELVTRVERAAPKAVTADVRRVATLFHDGLDKVVSTIVAGDTGFANALYDIDEWALGHCPYRVVDVTAVDFGFQQLPKSVPTGFVAFRVGNDSSQDHLFMVVRLKGDVTPAELATLATGDFLSRVEVVAAPVTAPPGLHVANYAQITKPGRYAAVDPNFLAEQMVTPFRVSR
jgi:hypothetical protein